MFPSLQRRNQRFPKEDHDSLFTVSGEDCTLKATNKKKGAGRGNVKFAISACSQCRRRKTRCSAQRPICSSCQARGLECSWDVPEGLTRHEDLRRKVREAELHLHHLCVFVGALKIGDIYTSTMLLTKLRLGVPIEELVQSLPLALFSSAAIELCYKQ